MATAKLSNQTGGLQISSELKQRLIFLILALVVYRICAHVPVPGVNAAVLADLFNKQSNQGGVLGLMNLFSGGALSRATIIALGITPYISASIIMQLAGIVVPSIAALQKEGASGQRKITQYTRYFTLVLAMAQSLTIATWLEGQQGMVSEPGLMFKFMTMVSLVTGTMFLMWLGEQVTERGLGNGISIIIFAGIVSGLPRGMAQLFEMINTGALSPFAGFIIVIMALLVTAFVVFVERAQRKIPINYAKRQVGNKIYGGQSSFLPLKLNMAGVIPAIFASSILLFPATVLNWLGNSSTSMWARDWASELSPGKPLYITLYAVSIVFFCFFYTALMFNSRETSDNLKKSGAVVPGIRPGEQTARYLDKIITRLTLVGALYMLAVCVLPELMILKWSVPFYFGGTSVLILVVVAMDFMVQVQSAMMSQQYESLMRKANFKGSK
ncbi:preprotein translocase subunit SecY [Hydromonas duriensis]|uniref:Protein translocase subunit SecY n=1 Tax=Hydromonas duriensis TaxID=1527608 RepID=A0A4R6Y275_9BURK|nr:preprotein translocase subunit SecY [Hydromonas duriensis]TDR30603.1 protein translocase subunit secY/sec61 alpha [Hydromonas duriensis]